MDVFSYNNPPKTNFRLVKVRLVDGGGMCLCGM